MTAYERLIDALRDHGCTVIDDGGKARAQCPAHDDRNPSLSVTRIEGSVLLYCQAGCATDDVLAAVNLTKRDLFDDRNGATYTYPGGRQVHRDASKRFRQSGDTKDKTLFHADRIGDTTTVYVCEGEKDVLAVEAVGGVAVCPAMGAGKAHLFDWSPLKGRDVIVVADKDKPGRAHAEAVADQLKNVAKTVRIVEAAVGKDAADHLAAGKTLEDFVAVDSPVLDAPRLWDATELAPAQQPEWLARRRLPRAAVSLLCGAEGIGKSLFWVWIAAAVTTGKPLPGFGIPAREPARVILVCTEDDWSTEVLPRLTVAGADISMIQVLCAERDGSGSPVFPRDIGLLRDVDAVLIVVDAWLDTVPSNLKVRDSQDARVALHPWKDVATATDAAVLLLTHTNRLASGDTRDTYGATYALRQKARMALYAAADDDGNLLIGPDKANGVRTELASEFTIKSVQHFNPTDDHDGTVPQLTWLRESDRTIAQHVLGAFESERSDDGDKQDRHDAVQWLSDYLKVEGPHAESADAKRAATKAGFSERTLQRARQELGVLIEYTGMPATTKWTLPTPANSGDEKRDGGDDTSGGDDTDEDTAPYFSGTTGTTGITTGQEGMPSHASGTTWHTKADQHKRPVVPPVPEKEGAVAQQRDHSRFQPDPPCFHCDKPVVSKHQDERGRYMHFECESEEKGKSE